MGQCGAVYESVYGTVDVWVSAVWRSLVVTCFQNWFTPFALQRSHGFATCSRGTGAFNLIQLLGLHSKSEKVGGMALRTYVGPSESTQVLNIFFGDFATTITRLG